MDQNECQRKLIMAHRIKENKFPTKIPGEFKLKFLTNLIA